MPTDFTSFTVKAQGGHLKVLKTDIRVRLAVSLLRTGAGQDFLARAIWDTGATDSMITKRISTALNLPPIARTDVRIANGKVFNSPVYKVDLLLPNSLTVLDVSVTEPEVDPDDFDVLIGMDVITIGDFAVTNADGITYFSFRFPPAFEHTDYVEQANKVRLAKEHKSDMRRFMKKQKYR